MVLRNILSKTVGRSLDEKAARYGHVEEHALQVRVNRMLEKIDAKTVLEKVFQGSVSYLVVACLFIVASICVSGKIILQGIENAYKWDATGNSSSAMAVGEHVRLEEGIHWVNCSGVLISLEEN